MAKKLLVFFVLVLVSVPALAQVDTAWVRRYDGPGGGSDQPRAIAVDESGNVYVTGTSYGSGTSADYATIKYNSSGDTVWLRRYNGPGNSYDLSYDVAVDDRGNVYVTGASTDTTGYLDFATIRYYSNGDTAWLRRYDGFGQGDNFALAMAVDASGNVYVTGNSYNGQNDDYLTIKYDSSGTKMFASTYDGPASFHDHSFAIAVDGSGNVYVTGESYGSGTNTDFATVKYNSSGDTVWVKRYNGPGNDGDTPRDIALDSDDNVLVTGESWGSGTKHDYATIKYYSGSSATWTKRHDGPMSDFDWVYDMDIDDSDNIYVTGTSTYLTGMHYLTIKYKPSGDTAWTRQLYSGFLAHGIAVDACGNAYVTGQTCCSDFSTIKYYCNGDSAWVKTYNGPGNSHDEGWYIAVDADQNVYVTGMSIGSGSSWDYATIKYTQTNNNPNSFSLLFPANKARTPLGVPFRWNKATDPDTCDQAVYDLYTSTSYDFPDSTTSIDSNITDTTFYKTFSAGTYYWKVKAKDPWGGETWSSQIWSFRATGLGKPAAQSEAERSPGLGDVVLTVNYLYRSGPAPDDRGSIDFNCSGEIDINDVIHLINHLFKGGPPPCN